MPKIMIIKYQQFAKTNTFSLSFHILFSPFLHIFPIFPQDTSKSGFGDGQKWGWTPPPNILYVGNVSNPTYHFSSTLLYSYPGDEVEDQNQLLDDFYSDMGQTEKRMSNVQKKLDKILNKVDSKKQNIIIGVLLVIMIIVVVLFFSL